MRALPDLLRMQRLALVDALETLAPEEWAWPSLCAGWTVQDMAAHLAWTPPMRPQELAAGVLRSGLQLHRLNDDNARRWSARGWDAVLRQLRTNAEQGLRPPGTPARAALTDAVVHAVDILRPLGRSVPLDPTAFRVVADFSAGLPWPPTLTLGRPRRSVRGIRLAAVDVPWTYGSGPEVRATAEALLRLLTGRPVGRSELTGPRTAELAARLERTG